MNKLKDRKGETLVEVLAAILVASLSVALLFGGVVASARIDRDAQIWDEGYYEALSAAEGRTAKAAPPDANGFKLLVTTDTAGIPEQPVDVELYGQKGAWAYAAVPKPPEVTPP